MLEQDFMKEVLKRFDKIDAKLDEHSNTLNEHSEEFKSIHNQLDKHSKFIHKNTELIMNNTNKIDKILKELNGFTEVVSAHHKILINYKTDFNKNKKFTKSKISGLDIRISALEDLYKSKLA